MVSTVATAFHGFDRMGSFRVPRSDELAPYTQKLTRGSTGWMYLAAGIILWDALSEEDEQLTRAFRRGLKSRRLLVGASWCYLSGHLFGVIPDQLDAIHLIGAVYRGRNRHGDKSGSPASGAGS